MKAGPISPRRYQAHGKIPPFTRHLLVRPAEAEAAPAEKALRPREPRKAANPTPRIPQANSFFHAGPDQGRLLPMDLPDPRVPRYPDPPSIVHSSHSSFHGADGNPMCATAAEASDLLHTCVALPSRNRIQVDFRCWGYTWWDVLLIRCLDATQIFIGGAVVVSTSYTMIDPSFKHRPPSHCPFPQLSCQFYRDI